MIRKIDSSGNVTTLAGQAGVDGSANGQGTEASFNNPFGVVVDSSGNLYVADMYNHLIRKISVVDDTVNFRVSFSDAAGNSGMVDNTTDGSVVAVDLEAPEVMDVSISSNNTDTSYGKVDDNVTLSFKTSEPIQIPSANDVTISGLTAVTLTGNENKTEWTASGTVTSGASGNASFNIS